MVIPDIDELVLLDKFVDTNGTLLSAHTMNLGLGWFPDNNSHTPNYAIIEDNAATVDLAVLNRGWAVTQSGRCNGRIRVTLHATSFANNFHILFRRTDNSNQMYAGFNTSGTNLEIAKIVGGVFTDLATGAATFVSGQTLEVRFDGPTIQMFWNDVLIATVTSTANLNGTWSGYDVQNIDGTIRITDFQQFTDPGI
jgi:hypothetical protein